LAIVDSDTFYVSFNRNGGTNVPGLGVVQDEDVVLYDTGTWSLFFDGSDCGLDLGESASIQNQKEIDALDVVNGVLYFSTLGGGSNGAVGGVAGPYDDADIYSWDSANCARVFDASANGLPGNADIDGLTVKGDTYYMSFNRNGGVSVPDPVGTVQDEAVVSYDTAIPAWSLHFSGSGLDLVNGQDVDGLHVP
jgi:hypothetical protein